MSADSNPITDRSVRSGERGVAAIVIALSVLILAGVAAIVIDVGALYEERRDLQNGADAAALAVAQSCALGEITCPAPAAAQPIAEQYASANANDGAAAVGSGDIVFDGNEVTVTTHTLDAGPNTDGDTGTVDAWFARVFGNTGTPVSATASARWGVPGTTTAIPIIFSSCEWDVATAGGTEFGPDHYRIIYLHDINTSSGGGGGPGGGGGGPGGGGGSTPPWCSNGPGMDVDGDGDRAEGGFGYLDSSGCSATISAGGFVVGQTGSGNPESLGCSIDQLLNQTLLVPIFDDVAGDGSTCGAPPGQNCYHVFGFAAFHVLDVDLTGGGWTDQGNICLPQQRCLGGYFDRLVTLEEGLEILDEGGAPDLGVSVVLLSG